MDFRDKIRVFPEDLIPGKTSKLTKVRLMTEVASDDESESEGDEDEDDQEKRDHRYQKQLKKLSDLFLQSLEDPF